MTRVIESTSEQTMTNIDDNTVFMMFVMQPKSLESQEEPPKPQWGIARHGSNGKINVKIGTAETQRAAFDALLTILNLSTDKNFITPFTPTDDPEWP